MSSLQYVFIGSKPHYVNSVLYELCLCILSVLRLPFLNTLDDRLKAADNIIAFQCSITHHIAVIRLFRIISIPSKVFLFSSAIPLYFYGMLSTGLPVSMYTMKNPVDMQRFNFFNMKNSGNKTFRHR